MRRGYRALLDACRDLSGRRGRVLGSAPAGGDGANAARVVTRIRRTSQHDQPIGWQCFEQAQQTIHHSAEYPSHIVLPIIPRGGAGTGSR